MVLVAINTTACTAGCPRRTILPLPLTGCCRCFVHALSLAACVLMQRAMEAVVSDWIGVLSGLPRLWEAGEVMPLVTSPGEEHPHHTPLAAVVDAGNFRALVAQLQLSWQAAFAQAEIFRQVIKLWVLHNLGQLHDYMPPHPPHLSTEHKPRMTARPPLTQRCTMVFDACPSAGQHCPNSPGVVRMHCTLVNKRMSLCWSLCFLRSAVIISYRTGSHH